MPRHAHFMLNNVKYFFVTESFSSDQCGSIEQPVLVYEWLKLVSERAWMLIMSCILGLWGGMIFREKILISMYDEDHNS